MKKFLSMLLAVVMVVSMFAGIGGSALADEVPEIVWYMVGGGMPSNYDSWKAKVDAYLEEKIGVHLDVQCVTWGDWGDRRTNVVTVNEPYDIMFTDSGSYINDVHMGAFADLTDLIKETPGLTDLIPAAYLQACEIDGKLYAIPAYKDSSMTQFFTWTYDIEDEDGNVVMEYASAHPEYKDAHTIADIGPILRAIHEETGDVFLMNKDGISAIIGNKYDNIGTGLPTIGISYRSGENKIVPVFEQEDVMADLRLMHEYFNEGLINQDAATATEATGICALGVAQGWPTAGDTVWGPGRGCRVVVSQFEDTVLSNDTVQGSMACISASSEHQLEALKLLELVNTDTWLRDALAYGEEGVNFKYVEDKDTGEKGVFKLNNDWTLAGYTQGTFFDMTLEASKYEPAEGEEAPAEDLYVVPENYYVNEVQVQNENAIPSPALGFIFDSTPVADQLAACQATFAEYKGLIQTGAGDPDVYVPEMMEAMRADGFDDIQAELQSQFDAWLAAK